MANKIINKGGDYLLLPKNGYLQTVSGSDTYKLYKAVDIEFDLAPPYELRYSADLDFDATPVGDVGSWSTSFPLTSDMVSADKTLDSTLKDDAQTISYWMYKLMKKQYPQIQFREIMKDTQNSPKTITHNWDGILTRIKRTRGATKGIYDILMAGIIKKHVDLVNE